MRPISASETVAIVEVDQRVEAAARDVAKDLMAAGRDALVGIYVHGSAVLGDFVPDRSDLDMLAVVNDDTPDRLVDVLGTVLRRARPMPATGLEVSVVDLFAARHPSSPWPFRLHVTTDPRDQKTVSGVGHPGDTDLVLHYLATRAFGWAASGPNPQEVFGPVPNDVVVAQLAAELRWAAHGAPVSYAILNSCRALRFVHDGTICSKTDGGLWALERNIRPTLVRAALDARGGEVAEPPPPESPQWVLDVAEEIAKFLRARRADICAPPVRRA